MPDLYTPFTGGEQPPEVPAGRLTEAEDAELRRLNYMAKTGLLSPRSRQRMAELRHRDRRQSIRNPKEFEHQVQAPQKRTLWGRIFG